jgi:hypothetical protein
MDSKTESIDRKTVCQRAVEKTMTGNRSTKKQEFITDIIRTRSKK